MYLLPWTSKVSKNILLISSHKPTFLKGSPLPRKFTCFPHNQFLNLEKSEDIHAINLRRSWIIDQFGALIRSGTIPKNDEWVQAILDWLVVNGLFVINKKSEKSPYQGVRYNCFHVPCSLMSAATHCSQPHIFGKPAQGLRGQAPCLSC